LLLVLPLVALALLTGCGSTAAPAAAPGAESPLPRYASITELATAVSARQKQDRTATLTLTGGVAGQPGTALSGQGALRFDETGTSARLSERVPTGGGPADVDLVALPDAAYLKLPPSAGLPAGKSWLRVVPGGTDPVSQRFGPTLQSMRESADPTRTIARYGDATTIVEAVEEPLDGVRSMRYRMRLDLVRAAASSTDPTTKANLERTVRAGAATAEYTMWLDAQNHIERVLLNQSIPGNQGTFGLEIRMRDWGRPVDISPPPADQVFQR
jgi:hypothetical protein